MKTTLAVILIGLALCLTAAAKPRVSVKITVYATQQLQRDLGSQTTCRAYPVGTNVNVDCREHEVIVKDAYSEVTVVGADNYSPTVHYKVFVKPSYGEKVFGQSGEVLMPGTYDGEADRGKLTIFLHGKKVKAQVVGTYPDQPMK